MCVCICVVHGTAQEAVDTAVLCTSRQLLATPVLDLMEDDVIDICLMYRHKRVYG